MKSITALVLFLFVIFIFNKVEKLIELLKKENPKVLEKYGNPKSAKDAYFMYSFLIMNGFLSESLPEQITSSAANAKKCIYAMIFSFIFSILALSFS